jgi:thioredoxin-dependent peroxiredoxin
MMPRLIAFALAALISSTALAAPGVGDTAPNWTLPGSDGQTHSLDELRGKHVVIAFFPKAYTSG